jgi:hypothetical protein
MVNRGAVHEHPQRGSARAVQLQSWRGHATLRCDDGRCGDAYVHLRHASLHETRYDDGHCDGAHAHLRRETLHETRCENRYDDCRDQFHEYTILY